MVGEQQKMTRDPNSLEWFLELREDRLGGIFQNIQEWGNRPIEFSQDPQGTNLYSIEETKRAYCRRFIEFAVASRTLLENEQIIAACTVARAQIETVAMAVFFVHEVSRLIRTGIVENFNAKIERFIIGTSSEESVRKPIHVNDALRYLQELDETYIRHLWTRYPTMKKSLSEIFVSREKSIDAEDVIGTVSVTKNYDLLCEFAHPNSLGTFFVFGQPENENTAQVVLRSRLIGLTKSATWQGHHMLKALKASEDHPDSYFSRFKSSSTPNPNRPNSITT